MKTATTDKDLEFHVSVNGKARIFATFEEACGLAVALAASDGKVYLVDVVCWTRRAAIKWGGDDAGDSYDEDPDASVFERIEIRAVSQGRIA